MKQPPSESRPAVRIEAENEWAWCGERRLRLTPKVFAVLRHLVQHADRLITKEELFSAVWGETIVSEATLASCIRDLRKALGDSSRAPRYVQTAHRRGFRFIGPIAASVHQPFAPGLSAPSRQGLEHRKVGFAGAVLLHALAARDTRSVPDRDLRQERLDQGGLADPWLAGDEHELAPAIDRARQPGMEPRELGRAPHQQRGQR